MADPLRNFGAILAGRVKLTVRRKAGVVLLYCLGVFFLAVAVVAGIVSLGIVLASRWGALSACLIIAGAALLMVIVMVLAVGWLARVERRRQLAEAAQWQQAMLAARAVFPEMTTGKALLWAAALGLVVGMKRGPSYPTDSSRP
jgi:uncharacterized SAM-binding protein YcdF (DUF218 family)